MLDNCAFFFLSHRKDTLPFKVSKRLNSINIHWILINLHLYSIFSSKQDYSFLVLFSLMCQFRWNTYEIHTCTIEVDLQGLFLKWTLLLSGFCGCYLVVVFKIDQIVLKIKFLLILSTASEFSNVVCFT